MQTIEHALAGLEVGAPRVHANLAAYPLSSAAAPATSYLLLNEMDGLGADARVLFVLTTNRRRYSATGPCGMA